MLHKEAFSRKHHWYAPPTGVTERISIFIIVSLSFCMSALASPGELSPEDTKIGVRPSYTQCLDASGGVTPVMRDCMSEEMGHQDDRLNRAYKSLMANLDPIARNRLRGEERAWIRKRDSRCAIRPDSGQGGELDAYGCDVQATTERAFELETMLKR